MSRARPGRTLVSTTALAVAAAVITVTGGAARAADPSFPDTTIHIDVKTQVRTTLPATSSSGSTTLTLDTEQTYDGSFQALYRNSAPVTVFAHGVVTWGAWGPYAACSANLTQDPDTTQQAAGITQPSSVDPFYQLSLFFWSSAVDSDGTPGGQCAGPVPYHGRTIYDLTQSQIGPPTTGPADYAAWNANYDPVVRFTPSPKKQTVTVPPYSKDGLSLATTIEFTGDWPTTGNSGSNPINGPPAPPKLSKAVKQAARDAARSHLGPATYACLTAATGAVVFGTLGITVGPIAGASMVAVAGPVCAREVGAMRQMLDTYADPADRQLHGARDCPPGPDTRAEAACLREAGQARTVVLRELPEPVADLGQGGPAHGGCRRHARDHGWPPHRGRGGQGRDGRDEAGELRVAAALDAGQCLGRRAQGGEGGELSTERCRAQGHHDDQTGSGSAGPRALVAGEGRRFASGRDAGTWQRPLDA